MQKKSNNRCRVESSPIKFIPDELIGALTRVEKISGNVFYLTGGTVRDWLLGRRPADLDITVKSGAAACCGELINQLGGGGGLSGEIGFVSSASFKTSAGYLTLGVMMPK